MHQRFRPFRQFLLAVPFAMQRKEIPINRNCHRQKELLLRVFQTRLPTAPPGYTTPTFNWRVANCSKQQVAGLLLNNMLSTSRDHKGDVMRDSFSVAEMPISFARAVTIDRKNRYTVPRRRHRRTMFNYKFSRESILRISVLAIRA